jgi:hypothetical protein
MALAMTCFESCSVPFPPLESTLEAKCGAFGAFIAFCSSAKTPDF